MKDQVIKRVTKTLELFIENKGEISDEQLARLLSLEGIKTSSSTVGRDLTINLKKLFEDNYTSKPLLEKESNIIKYVAQKRNENKYKGQINGGVKSAFNNDILKDEYGKFRGSVKRHG